MSRDPIFMPHTKYCRPNDELLHSTEDYGQPVIMDAHMLDVSQKKDCYVSEMSRLSMLLAENMHDPLKQQETLELLSETYGLLVSFAKSAFDCESHADAEDILRMTESQLTCKYGSYDDAVWLKGFLIEADE